MHGFIVASDFDGTLKEKSKEVSSQVLLVLQKLRKSGIGVILVTGRCKEELSSLIDFSLFDAIVLENGALVLVGRTLNDLSPMHWKSIREVLISQFGGGPEQVILSLPRETKLSLNGIASDKIRLEYNKDRVMILPAGISKATGLKYAISKLGWEKRMLICAGDGENDISMMHIADLKVAFKNSVDELKRIADLVVESDDGDGFIEAMKVIFPYLDHMD